MTKPLVRVVIPVIPGAGTGDAILREYRFRTTPDPDLKAFLILPVFAGDPDQVKVFSEVATELRGLEADQSFGAVPREFGHCVEVTVLKATLTRGSSSMLGAACGFIAARAADPARLRPLTATGALTLPTSPHSLHGRLGDCITVQPVVGLKRKLEAIISGPRPPDGLLIALPATNHPNDAADLACIVRLITDLRQRGDTVLRAELLSQVLAAWIAAPAWLTPQLAAAYAGAAMPARPGLKRADIVKEAQAPPASARFLIAFKFRIIAAALGVAIVVFTRVLIAFKFRVVAAALGVAVVVFTHAGPLPLCGSIERLDCPLVLVPPGSFVRGVPLEERQRENSDDSDAGPLLTVTLTKPFLLGRVSVTRWQYALFARDTGRLPLPPPPFTQEDDHPAVNVKWADAAAYADWLSQRTGRRYRLPTEAEWEWAARGGTATARFWGDGAKEQCRYANGADEALQRGEPVRQRVAPCNDGYANTAPVGHYLPNPFGLADMLGNAFQWTADCYRTSYDPSPVDGSAETGGGCRDHVARGGSWQSDPAMLRSGVRTHQLSLYAGEAGFRIARDVDR